MNQKARVLFIIAIVLAIISPVLSWASIDQDLGEIVVTSTRIAQSGYNVAGDVTVISRQQIEDSCAASVPEVLKEALGVNVYDSSTTKTARLDIRGFGETSISNVLFLVNDRKTNSIDMSGADLLQIPIEAVERIEIIRGAASVLYGDNAVGGVVNIITKKGEGALKGKAGYQYGSYNRQETHAEVSGEKKGVSYYFYSKYNDDRGYRQNSDLLAEDYNLRLGYKASEKLSLDLETGWHTDDYGQPGSLDDTQMETLGRRGTANPDDDAQTKDRFVNLSMDLNPWPGDLDFGKFNVDVSFRNRDSYSNNASWGMTTKNSIDTVGINGKYIFYKTIFDRHVNFVTGIDYYDNENRVRRESPAVTEYVISKQEFGVYGFSEYELFDHLFINGGSRYQKADYNFNQRNGSEDTAKNPHQWVSMGGLKYEYAKGSNVFANVQQTFRFLATDEWLNTISGVLNTNLKQQTGIQYEAGIKHNFNDAVVATVTPYIIDTNNEIYYNPQGGNFGWGANENYDKTRRVGVEFGNEVDLLKFFNIGFLNGLDVFTNYTYEQPKFSKGPYDGKDVPLAPRQQGNAGFKTKFLKYYNFNLTERYVGSRFVGSDTSNTLSPLKPYWVLDGKLSYCRDNYEIFAEVNNILSAKYSSYVSSYGTTKYYYPDPERNYNIGVNVKF
ncbi:MAG: TonB-dependent receptor [Candidatus Omnitrophica bacterium]|nr:TonB-dependent receptor [Candidatus Omnitrophota bacterium]